MVLFTHKELNLHLCPGIPVRQTSARLDHGQMGYSFQQKHFVMYTRWIFLPTTIKDICAERIMGQHKPKIDINRHI